MIGCSHELPLSVRTRSIGRSSLHFYLLVSFAALRRHRALELTDRLCGLRRCHRVLLHPARADTADAVLLGGSLPLCFVNPFSGLFHHSGSSSTVLLVLGSQCFLPFPFPEHFECVLAAGRFMWLGRGWLG